MRSANTIMKSIIKSAFFGLLMAPLFCFSQINSPYSRYGVGNILPQASIANRAMGGISAGMADNSSLNTVNPASYGNLQFANLDIGIEYNGNNLKSKDPVGNFKSNYGMISYVNIGIPLLSTNKKAFKNKTAWTLAFGLKPITRISYKTSATNFNGTDSITSVYEGSGGLNEAYVGMALKLKNFSIGFNSGYLFGEKDYSTRLFFKNDTVSYYNANFEDKARFGGVFLNAGMQYTIPVKGGQFRLGAYGNLKSKYNGTKDEVIETFAYDTYESPTRIDSVRELNNEKGSVTLPATLGFGFSLEKEHFLMGLDFETTKWDSYRFFGKQDQVQNSWIAKAGFQFYPYTTGTTGYFNYVKYRAGFSVGKDYINVDNNLPVYSVSLGGAFPLKIKHSYFDRQYSIMNIAFEYGTRGNKNNNITESMFKVSLGFSLSDVWFLRQKYQ